MSLVSRWLALNPMRLRDAAEVAPVRETVVDLRVIAREDESVRVIATERVCVANCRRAIRLRAWNRHLVPHRLRVQSNLRERRLHVMKSPHDRRRLAVRKPLRPM